MKSTIWKQSLAAVAIAASLVVPGGDGAEAQTVVRAGAARTSVHASNVRVNRNVNVSRSVNVHYDRWGHPLAAAAAVTATAVAIGTVVSALPSRCSTLSVGAVTYQDCGGVYYQPVYQGNSVQYVVVNAPQ
jgi:hypothetical protein